MSIQTLSDSLRYTLRDSFNPNVILRSLIRRSQPPRVTLAISTPQFAVYITRYPDEIHEAQRLRYRVFREEMKAPLNHPAGIDEDRFDALCDHLIVRDNQNHEVVGTYRILGPREARTSGYYSDSEFYTERLAPLKPNMAEFGRACVHPAYRTGSVMMLLWSGLGCHMMEHGYDHVIGSASLSMDEDGREAMRTYQSLRTRHLAKPEYRVFPRRPLSQLLKSDDEFGQSAETSPAPSERSASSAVPPLIRAYLRLGAKICGEPTWDPHFNTADLFMLLSLEDLNARHARHFHIQRNGRLD